MVGQDGSRIVRSAGVSLAQSRFVVAAVVCLAAVVRIRMYLADRSLWLDEALLANRMLGRPLGELVAEPLGSNQSAPPGFLLGVGAATSLLGETALGLRALPLLVGIVAVVASAYLGLTVFGRSAAAFTYLALAATSPALVYYSSEVKQYGTDAAATTIALAVGLRFERWRHGTIIAAATGVIAVWLSLPAMFVMMGIGATLTPRLIRERRVGRLATLGVTWGTAALGAGAWTIRITGDRDGLQSFWERSFAPNPVTDPAWYLERVMNLVFVAVRGRGPATPGSMPTGLDLVTVGLFVVFGFGVVIVMRQPSLARVAMTALLTSMAVALLASATDLYPFDARLLLFLSPMVFLALSAATMRRPGVPAMLTWGARAVIAVSLVSASAYSVREMREPTDHQDVKSVLAHVDAHRMSGDQIVMTAWTEPAYSFHAPSQFRARTSVQILADDVDPTRFVQELAATAPGRIWLVGTHRLGSLKGAIRLLEAHTDPLDEFETSGSGAYLFDLDNEFSASVRRSG